MYSGYLYIIIAALLWALLGPVSKFTMADGVSPIEVGFFRAFFASIFFTIQAGYSGKTAIDIKDIPLLVIFGILGITIFYSANFIAVKEGGAAFASVLLYTAPAWVALLSYILFKEKISIKKIISIVFTISGVACICFIGKNNGGGDVNFSTIAIISGIFSGLSYSMYYLFGKYFSGKYEAPTLFMYIMPIGALAILPFVNFSNKTTANWIGLLFIAFFSTFIPNSFYYKGLSLLEPTRAVLTATIEPVAAAFFAWLFWDELFSAHGAIGAMLVITAVVIIVFDKTKV